MKKLKKSGLAVVWMVCLTVLTGISGCDETQDIQNWVENTNKLRLTAKAQSDIVPYRTPQHQALKSYFAELGSMALALKNDPKFSSRFNEAVSKADLAQVCSKVFVSKREWQLIMQRCTRNRFFLCAEEVRAYSDIVTSIRGQLGAENQRRFDQSQSCRSAL